VKYECCVTYCDQLRTIFSKETVCAIYVCISGVTSDEDTECTAEFEEVFGVVQMKRKLVVQKVGVPNILVCICMGLISWWWGYALLSVRDPLDYL
jgi:hypothetical protein